MTIEQLTYTADGCTMMCLVDDEMLGKYREHEEGITPSHVVDSFDVFKFESGKQGTMLRPSNTELSSAFGTANRDQVIEFMLENGELPVHHQNNGGKRNDSPIDRNSRFHVERSGRPL